MFNSKIIVIWNVSILRCECHLNLALVLAGSHNLVYSSTLFKYVFYNERFGIVSDWYITIAMNNYSSFFNVCLVFFLPKTKIRIL